MSKDDGKTTFVAIVPYFDHVATSLERARMLSSYKDTQNLPRYPAGMSVQKLT